MHAPLWVLLGGAYCPAVRQCVQHCSSACKERALEAKESCWGQWPEAAAVTPPLWLADTCVA